MSPDSAIETDFDVDDAERAQVHLNSIADGWQIGDRAASEVADPAGSGRAEELHEDVLIPAFGFLEPEGETGSGRSGGGLLYTADAADDAIRGEPGRPGSITKDTIRQSVQERCWR